MAAINGLLDLAGSQGADGLLLEEGKAPALTFEGAERSLTMPPLDRTAIERLLREILPDDKKSALAGHAVVEVSHPTSRGGRARVRLEHGPAGLVVWANLRPDAAPPAAVRSAAAAGPAPGPGPAATSAGDAVAAGTAGPLPGAADGGGVVTAGAPGAAPPAVAAGAAEIWGLLREALERDASDVLLSTAAPPVVRLVGELVELPAPPVAREALLDFFAAALTPPRREQLAASGSVDFAFAARGADLGLPGGRRFRVNLFEHLTGLTAALRPLWEQVPSLEELHLPARLLSLVAAPSGLVLLAGLAGSGKSTTFAALVEHVNQTRARHIVTLEDPIELVFRRRRSVVHQREVGTHVESFAAGLRAALRESPDLILVGEMRDRETIALALTAAETGHLVLATIHSGSAATAIDRVVDVFAESQQAQVRAQLANVLRSIVTQRLLPGRAPGQRVPVLEILNVNPAVASHVREGKVHMIPNQMQVGADEAMLPFDRCLVDVVRRGLVSAETALAAARDPDFVRGALGEPRGPGGGGGRAR